MKKITVLFTLIILSFATNFVYGQGRFGADSAECVKYLSFYTEYMKQGNIDEASPLWHKAIATCPPTASQNMLLDGMKILRRHISKYRNNPVRKKELVDSIMMLHDLRIENYPKYLTNAKVNKASDMATYLSAGSEKEVFDAMGDAMDAAKANTPVSIIVRYMSYANDMYTAGTMTGEEVMEAFQKSTETVNLVEKRKATNQTAKARKDIENLFMQSGVANCENLVALFAPRYAASPNDKEILANIVAMMSASDCTDDELFFNAVQSLHAIEPSHNSAYFLFKLSSDKGQVEKAVEYMTQAIDNEASDANQDSEYLFELATYYYRTVGNDSKAVQAAKKAGALSDELRGKAYFLIGSIWGSQKCEGNDVEIRAPYWIAVDYLNKAKNADSSLATEANNLIRNYSQYFPQKSAAFMVEVIEGADYTVSCNGLRETTKVRTQE